MNARYYVPNTNRWLSPDTIVPDPANPQSFNRYSYVRNNPVNFYDPTGHCEENGDESCWAFAESLNRKYGIDLAFFGIFVYQDLEFIDASLEWLQGYDSQMMGTLTSAINQGIENHNLVEIAQNLPSSFDVFGARGDYSASAILGGDLSVDFIFNFESREFSIMLNANFTIGLQGGSAGALGFFFGFNAPSNADFSGFGTGLTAGLTVFGGANVQFDMSGKILGLAVTEASGDITKDAWNLAVMYSLSPIPEAELSYSVGWSWEIARVKNGEVLYFP